LPAPCWQIPLQDEHQHYVPFASEVRDILGDDGSVFGSGACRNLRVVGRPEADLGDVNSVMAVCFTQKLGYGHREHLID
jgi:hypothetical protein